MPKTLSIFTIWSIQASNHIITPPSLPHQKSAMHHPLTVLHSFWLNPDGARSKSIPCCLTVAVSSLSSHGHHHSRLLVLSAFEDCGVVVFLISCVLVAVVCYTYIIMIWTSTSIHTLNSCRDVLRSYEHNLCQFVFQVQTGQSWYSKFLNSSHSQYLLNLFC
jgi:hypothetical protein